MMAEFYEQHDRQFSITQFTLEIFRLNFHGITEIRRNENSPHRARGSSVRTDVIFCVFAMMKDCLTKTCPPYLLSAVRCY